VEEYNPFVCGTFSLAFAQSNCGRRRERERSFAKSGIRRAEIVRERIDPTRRTTKFRRAKCEMPRLTPASIPFIGLSHSSGGDRRQSAFVRISLAMAMWSVQSIIPN
jgi:hypothetical protein